MEIVVREVRCTSKWPARGRYETGSAYRVTFDVLFSHDDALADTFSVAFSVECSGHDEALDIAHKRLALFSEKLLARAREGRFRFAGHRDQGRMPE